MSLRRDSSSLQNFSINFAFVFIFPAGRSHVPMLLTQSPKLSPTSGSTKVVKIPGLGADKGKRSLNFLAAKHPQVFSIR